MTAPGWAFRVDGMPAPQGSKRHVGNGVLIEMSNKVAPWRKAIVKAFREEYDGLPPLDGPLTVSATFWLPRPKTGPNARSWFPAKRPDLDKLVRSSFDGLVTAGAMRDDSQVCGLHTYKDWASDLEPPGAFFSIYVRGYGMNSEVAA